MKDIVIACFIININRMWVEMENKKTNEISMKNQFSFLLIYARFLLICFALLFLVSCSNNNDIDIKKIKEQIEIDDVLVDDVELVKQVEVGNSNYNIYYNFDDDAINQDGEIFPFANEDRIVNVNARIEVNGLTETIDLGSVTVKSMEYICSEVEKEINVPNEISGDIDLPSQVGKVRLRWNSSNTAILSKEGKCICVDNDTNLKLSCIYSMKTVDDSYQIEKEYDIVVKPWDFDVRVTKVMDYIRIPDETFYDVDLPVNLDYGIKCRWTSSNQNIISNDGVVNRSDDDTKVTLSLELYSNNTDKTKKISYEVMVLSKLKTGEEMNFYKHILVNRANELDLSKASGLKLDNDGRYIVLKDDKLEGVYESPIFNTYDFYRIVGNTSCITGPNFTCELEYSVKVNGNWSKYFSYGRFGLGKLNVYYDQYDTDAVMDTDMIEPRGDNVGDAVKYRVTLRRDKLSDSSPKLSLVATTVFMRDYKYVVDTSNLPDKVDWDVPKLYQHDVPVIGNQICSATTTTMLLKFAGYDFSDKGYKYEHEYMSNMVADTGHNNPTYGNWSYNMMAASAFGIDAYVGKYYSWDEIKYHLANYGPIGISIAGRFGIYSTNGHLLVLRGYRDEGGKTTVICNDPNVKGTYYEVTLETLLECMGSVVYIMEFNGVKIIK